MRLAVELYDTVVGTLNGDFRTFDFTPTAEGIDRFGTNSPVLSTTIPLIPNQRRNRATRRRNWFAELLPEGDQYDYMLTQGQLRRDDTPAFLARYGRDVAGALQIWDLDDPTEPKTPTIRLVNRRQVRNLLEDPIGSPLANDADAGKSSLGGVQPKVVLAQTPQGWAQVLGGYPSTHILKPQLGGGKATVIYDEEYGLRLARRLGLTSFGAWIEDFADLRSIVIERFDRDQGRRVHQEDFSQVLGASRNEKYQELGGIVSLHRIAAALTRFASDADLRRLAQMAVLSVAIGNLDMHSKNLGLLHPADHEVALAPAYDVVPQAHLSNDGKLALAVNKKYRHREVTRDDLVAEIASWGLARAAKVVDGTLEQLVAVIADETPLAGAYGRLHEQVLRFTTNLCNGKPVGGRVS